MKAMHDPGEDSEINDLEDQQRDALVKQRISLDGAKLVGEECITMASDIKSNLKGQSD